MNSINPSNELPFDEWLQTCASIAMDSEWCIDPAWRWRELYDAGFSAGQAIDALFEEVNAK